MIDEITDIETAALADLQAAATEELRARLKISVDHDQNRLVSMAAVLPPSAIVVNRTIGLGLNAPATRSSVEAVVDAYRNAGITRYFVHVHPKAEPANLKQWLSELDLRQTRGWVKFKRGRDAPPPSKTDLQIRRAVDSDREAFGRTLADAFDLGEAAAPWIGQLINRPGWYNYMSFDGDIAAGTGSMFVKNGVAWMDWAATDPKFRRRGSQSAILVQRISDALDLGCHLLVTATGEEVPGDPQHSYHNIQRKGFEPAYVVRNYAPPKSAGNL
ncbi:MAG: hypothetical protein QNI91_18190 [Arenicellales bacterium]|nr:hypothetical protein [Arenicellales bacterium]